MGADQCDIETSSGPKNVTKPGLREGILSMLAERSALKTDEIAQAFGSTRTEIIQIL